MAATTTARSSTVRLSVDELASHLETLEAELSGGRSIELLRGETVIAEVRAPQTSAAKPEAAGERSIPDFMARLKAMYGDEVLPAGTTTQWIRDDRDGL
ncbi:hypothetical protein GOB94_04985 [Granulicella sp. 5B5]|uniref:hypothetical protein n=1 Tax=Granulicella sp. 5B5 TaxID=1617967 RepID=UPI00176954E9|nr:hypothetical protein [Granulicella sp. 5B5]QMV18119.1 hypothetical protein GOB94_04985 [Granulicella sp. 5B5]